MPGTDLNITLPVVGTDSWPVWADRVTTALTTIINDIEAQVVTSEILENADHDFNGFAITDARWVVFRQGNTSSIPTYGVGFKNGDLWAGDASGNQIQITSGGLLAGVGNGFRGDTAYAKYTAGSNLYEFLDASNNYDDVKANAFFTGTGAKIDGGGAATVVSLPTTNPGAVALISMSAAGQLSHNTAVTTTVTLNNANVAFTGTGKLAFPTRQRNVPLRVADASLPVKNVTFGTTSIWPIPLAEGERVISATIRMDPGGVGNTRLRLQRGTDGTLVAQTLSTASTFLDVAPGPVGTQTMTLQTPYAYAGAEALYITVEGPATSGSSDIFDLKAGVDSI